MQDTLLRYGINTWGTAVLLDKDDSREMKFELLNKTLRYPDGANRREI